MAFDAFMEINKDGKPAVQGETLDEFFRDSKAFELTKFRLMSQRDLASEGLMTQDEEYEPLFVFNIQKEIDSATPDLFLNFCRFASTKRLGTFDEIVVTIRKAAGSGQMPFLIYRFIDCYIKTWRLENTDDDALPEEVVDFCFHACAIAYIAQRPGGEGGQMTEGQWDFWSPNSEDAV